MFGVLLKRLPDIRSADDAERPIGPRTSSGVRMPCPSWRPRQRDTVIALLVGT